MQTTSVLTCKHFCLGFRCSCRCFQEAPSQISDITNCKWNLSRIGGQGSNAIKMNWF